MAQQIIIPVFPAPGGYSKFVTVPDYVPTVGFAVLDISLYAGPVTDPFVIDNWRQVIKKYNAAGMPLLGYVPTDCGTSVNNAPTRDGKVKKLNRSLADVQAFVDHGIRHSLLRLPTGSSSMKVPLSIVSPAIKLAWTRTCRPCILT
jgi:hypothetical protein